MSFGLDCASSDRLAEQRLVGYVSLCGQEFSRISGIKATWWAGLVILGDCTEFPGVRSQGKRRVLERKPDIGTDVVFPPQNYKASRSLFNLLELEPIITRLGIKRTVLGITPRAEPGPR